MLTPEDKLQVLQRFVDNFAKDLVAVRDVVGEPSTPEAAKRFLIGGLNYALDALDMFPDHFKGIGIADDAIVLRVASKLAFNAGAKHPTVEALAIDANLVIALFDDLAGPLEQLVSKFPDRDVRGRNAAKILASKDVHVSFDADIGREAKRHVSAPVAGTDTPERTVIELHKMLAAALKRAGLV
jgi:uncharacterized membrane protein YkvA (DUF1232 family)